MTIFSCLSTHLTITKFPPFFFAVIDCILSDWGSWSDCDKECGPGTMSRSRTIIRAPENGGKRCQSLVQKRGCSGYKCHNHDMKALKGENSIFFIFLIETNFIFDFFFQFTETALLLPIEYSQLRRENDTVDIRRNLRLRYKDFHRYNREHEWVHKIVVHYAFPFPQVFFFILLNLSFNVEWKQMFLLSIFWEWNLHFVGRMCNFKGKNVIFLLYNTLLDKIIH